MVLINTQNDPAYTETWEFIRSFKNRPGNIYIHHQTNQSEIAPRILFTHIPLWRPPGVHCGKSSQKHSFLIEREGYS
jgi:hypothetical protein